MKFVICFLIVLSALVMILDFSRFYDVDVAKTQEQLEIACERYGMTSIKDVPVKCVDIIKTRLAL